MTAKLPIHLFFHLFNQHLLSTYYMLHVGILGMRRQRAWRSLLFFLLPFSSPLPCYYAFRRVRETKYH